MYIIYVPLYTPTVYIHTYVIYRHLARACVCIAALEAQYCRYTSVCRYIMYTIYICIHINIGSAVLPLCEYIDIHMYIIHTCVYT